MHFSLTPVDVYGSVSRRRGDEIELREFHVWRDVDATTRGPLVDDVTGGVADWNDRGWIEKLRRGHESWESPVNSTFESYSTENGCIIYSVSQNASLWKKK